MEGKLKKLFTLYVIANEYYNEEQDKIEVEDCETAGSECLSNLSLINRNFRDSQRFFLEKDYTRSIEELQIAFNHTRDIESTQCSPCTHVVRATITQSLEYIQEDLQKMTSGLFRAGRYDECYQRVSNVLDDFRKAI